MFKRIDIRYGALYEFEKMYGKWFILHVLPSEAYKNMKRDDLLYLLQEALLNRNRGGYEKK